MNTDNEIELNDLEAIEQRLNTEGGRSATSQERAAGGAGRSLGAASENGFEIA